MTVVPMVFDICVEPHAPFRVMRQFGLRQAFPVPFPQGVTATTHRYVILLSLLRYAFIWCTNASSTCSFTRKGHPASTDWVAKLDSYVQDWLLAMEEIAKHDGDPHTDEAYQAYLCWYQPRTRTTLTFAPREEQAHVASLTDLYARHRDQDFARAEYCTYVLPYKSFCVVKC